ncbi:MAG: xanthine dehydrogenase family protein subunit M [Chloroflexi bacterium]|nr:MAG: xanthine dehydrogenase family protein subunit M [Chloroflexota bacterium]
MKLWKEYLRPTTVTDALSALATGPGPAMPIAGGTDLMLDLQQGRHDPVHTLVDLTFIPEMTALEVRGDELFIGAAKPVSKVVESDLVLRHAQALVESAGLIAGPQVRNAATLGGNVAHALPAADGTISLVALDTRVEIASLSGRRQIPIRELFAGPGKSILSGQELIVGFTLPLCAPHQASAFRRIMRAQGIALPILNLALWLEREGDIIRQIRIAVGPGGPTPWRAHATEEFLCGRKLDAETLPLALQTLLDEVRFRTSPQRATAEYRRELVGTLLKDAFETAWERAK